MRMQVWVRLRTGVFPALQNVTMTLCFLLTFYVWLLLYGKIMSWDVPICSILAICREALNREIWEVLYIMGSRV